MADLIAKLLLLAFGLAVGGCFALWPEKVNQHFAQWRGSSSRLAEDEGTNTHKRQFADLVASRQIRLLGILLIAFTGYTIYLWAKTG